MTTAHTEDRPPLRKARRLKRSRKKRTREIMGVLRKHDIIHGLTPEKFYLILSDLGPTFIKLGQLLSMRSDLLPQPYCDELAKLRTITNPMEFSQLKDILRQEYGKDPDDIFARIDAEPLGAASVAQVHRARLKSGHDVVLKVQRQGIYETMAQDILLLKKAASILKTVGAADQVDWRMVLDEMWHVAQEEMSFSVEAAQMLEFQHNHSDVKYLDFPQVFADYSTDKVLVMETIDGHNIDDIETLKAHGYDLEEIAGKLAHNYIKQVIEDGFFHADPHAGNIKIRDGKIIWIDLGMMGRLTAHDKELFISIFRSIIDNNSSKMTDAVLAIGVVNTAIDYAELADDIDVMISQYISQDFRSMDFMKLSEDLFRVLRKHQISLPQGISILGRGMVTLHSVLSLLSENINFMSILSSYFANDFMKHFNPKVELNQALRLGYSSLKRSLEIPAQFSDALQALNRGRTRINIEYSVSENTKTLIASITHKLVLSIMFSVLFLGSALLCFTKLTPQILGIPYLAFLGFLGSLTLGAFLVRTLIKRRT